VPRNPGLNDHNAVGVSFRPQQETVWPKAKTASMPTDQPIAIEVKFPANSKARVFALYVTE
jgi:hypothetical protein